MLAIRDEADIIDETIEHLLTWVDALHVFDTGSTDDTWDRVRAWAGRDGRVKPFMQREICYGPHVYARIFDAVRGGFEHGDWIARLDGDEIYHVAPPRFIAERVGPHEGLVFVQDYQFVLTHGDLAEFEAGANPARWSAPIQERCRRYVIEPVVEPRLFRYRPSMRWAPDQSVPWGPGHRAVARIPVRHYRWRSPRQMEERCRLRIATLAVSPHGVHWGKDWREWLWDDADPRLRVWGEGGEDGGDLHPHQDTNHLEPPLIRAAKGLYYRSGLVTLRDRTRPGWCEPVLPDPPRVEPLPGADAHKETDACRPASSSMVL